MDRFPIETDRLVLRPFKLSDANDYFEMTRDKAIQKYLPYAYTTTIKETKQTIKQSYMKGDFIHDYYIVIESKEIHKVIGAIIATEGLEKKLEYCIMIAKEHRRKGYITEATKAFIKVLPSRSVLEYVIRSDNEASLKSVNKIENVVEMDPITDVLHKVAYYYRVFDVIVP
ncbi:MAG: GNAT family N-acetyltransferase [Clostridia bacterium]|nr:GNAT family N-acetyltransferase [Clostridia bacterium]